LYRYTPEDVFVTSKCCHNDPCDFTYAAAWRHVNQTLRDLGLAFVDHYAVHVPGIPEADAKKCAVGVVGAVTAVERSVCKPFLCVNRSCV
jgi:diketogulonate reductase-like aldo/keto reductase